MRDVPETEQAKMLALPVHTLLFKCLSAFTLEGPQSPMPSSHPKGSQARGNRRPRLRLVLGVYKMAPWTKQSGSFGCDDHVA